MGALFGPAGNSDSFSRQYKSSLDAPEWIRSMGLDAYEYQGGKGVHIGEATARALGERARTAGALANNCSRKEDCDFYFPSIVRKDQTVIGINGGGQDHGKVRELRCRLERFLDAPGNY